MRTTIIEAFAAATLATAMFIAGTLPTSAQVARPLSALAVGDSDDGIVTLVRRGGGGGGGGMRGGGGGMRMGGGGFHRGGRIALADRGAYNRAGINRHHWHDRHHHHGRHHGHHHRHHNDWWWGGGYGLALGYGLGYGYGYGSDYGYYDDPYYYRTAVYAGNGAVAACARRFRSYDIESQTYVLNNGRRRSCP